MDGQYQKQIYAKISVYFSQTHLSGNRKVKSSLQQLCSDMRAYARECTSLYRWMVSILFDSI